MLLFPGVSIGAILAMSCYGGAIYYAFSALGTTAGIWTVVAVVILSLITVVISLRSKTWMRLSLKQEIDSTSMPNPALEVELGSVGVTVSRLAPMGKVNIGGKFYEAKSVDVFIDQQVDVKVVGFDNFTVIVKKVELTPNKTMKPIVKLILAVIVAGLSPIVASADSYNPKADDKAVVVVGNARFTVLTPQLIRMEWSEDGVFEDRATLTFVNRNIEVPQFKVYQSRSKVVIKTDKLRLIYHKGEKFSAKNLSAEFMLGPNKVVWHYGDTDSLNLMGTTRTLDKADGWNLNPKDPMEPGVISRSGWSVVDDSDRHLFVDVASHWQHWVECRPEKEYQDLYLFAYGHDYMQAVKDYITIAGRIPLPPKYAFGYWWSRYWQYSDNELRDLIGQLRSLDVPIDVLIVDMDWHETWGLRRTGSKKDEYGQRIGWTGYTWKEQLFPSPANFFEWCRSENLKTALNLHPASGIQPYEEPYKRFIEAYEWKEEGKSVPFRIDEQKWADAYFNTVLAPFETIGVDFWWLDWQQWKESKYTKGLSNTFWLNHTFNKHSEERGNERPMIYHRWGGLGSHRYQVGFSGDVYINWESLGFLPWFTSTASNVGYGYWGHDIGGHMFKVRNSQTDPELYLRWLQYGVFTPIFKTHCTKSSNIERRIWQFPDHIFFMRDAIRLRYTLAPYIYNAARQAYDTGISMCRPMYYYYPECNEAYDMKEQYMFGDDMLVTAIVKPVDVTTGVAERTMWFPEGKWYDMVSGRLIEGNQTLSLSYTVAENPYYVRAGAIIPMNPPTVKNLQDRCDTLVLTFIPGADGQIEYYEDDGVSKDYTEQFAVTKVTKTSDSNSIRVVISPRQGSYKGAAESRKYELRFPAQMPAQSVKVNGVEVPYKRYAKSGEWGYDGYTLSPIVYTNLCDCDKECVVELAFDSIKQQHQTRLYGKQGIFNRCVHLTPEFKERYAVSYDPYPLLPDEYMNVSQTPNFIMEYPQRIVEWLDRYEQSFEECIPSLEKSGHVDAEFITKLKAQFK